MGSGKGAPLRPGEAPAAKGPGPTPVWPCPPLTLSETVSSSSLNWSCRFLPELTREQRLVHATVSPGRGSRAGKEAASVAVPHPRGPIPAASVRR